jgi:hypothetical protein
MDWKRSWHSFLDIGFERTEFVKRYNNPPHIFNKKISTHQDIDEIDYECKNHHISCNTNVITNVFEFESCIEKLVEWTRDLRKQGMSFHWVIQFDELPHDMQFYNRHSCYWPVHMVDFVHLTWRGIDINRNFDQIVPCKNWIRSIVSFMQDNGLLVKLQDIQTKNEEESKKEFKYNVSFEDVSFACTLQKIRDDGIGNGCVLPIDVIDRIFTMATNGVYVPKREMNGIMNQRENAVDLHRPPPDPEGLSEVGGWENVDPEGLSEVGEWEEVFFQSLSH